MSVGLDASAVNSSATAAHLQPPRATTTVCVTASTGINSLSLALGSTFGAFLALGVIVAFVLIAKYQYIRRKRKSIQIQLLHRCDDSIDSLPAATAADITRDNEDDDEEEDATERRPTVNGTIELKRLSRQATLGRVPDDDEDADDDPAAAAGNHGGAGVDDDDSRSSDFSADIILHDTVVQATSTGFPVSMQQDQLSEMADGGDSDMPRRLVLDSATCAGSFILANDEPTGRTYSLLVPITSPAVQPLLATGGDAQAGGPRLLRISGGGLGGGSAAAGGGGGGGQSIVRLKLRKHATVDYSTVEEDGGMMPGPLGSTPVVAAERFSRNGGHETAARADEGRGRAVQRTSVCWVHQGDISVAEQPQQTDVIDTTTSERKMTRSLSSDW